MHVGTRHSKGSCYRLDLIHLDPISELTWVKMLDGVWKEDRRN